jgi:hypothetical protein
MGIRLHRSRLWSRLPTIRLALLVIALRIGGRLLRRLVCRPLLVRLLLVLLGVALLIDLVRRLRVWRVLPGRRGRRRVVRVYRLLRQRRHSQRKHSSDKNSATSHSAYENAKSAGELRHFSCCSTLGALSRPAFIAGPLYSTW